MWQIFHLKALKKGTSTTVFLIIVLLHSLSSFQCLLLLPLSLSLSLSLSLPSITTDTVEAEAPIFFFFKSTMKNYTMLT